MDPASLLCTIITIGSAGIAAAQSAEKLYRAVEDARMFEDIIVRVATDFETFAQTIEMTKLSLTATTKKYPKLQMAEWFNTNGLAKNLESMSKDIKLEIKAFTARYRRAAKQGLLSFTKKVTWAFFHREDGQKLYPRMQLLNTFFMTVLSNLRHEVLLASPSRDSPEVKEELAQLKKLIKHQGKAIQNLAFHSPIQTLSGTIGGGNASRSAMSLAMEHIDIAKTFLAMNEVAQKSRTVRELRRNLDKVTETTRSASARSTSADRERRRRRRREQETIEVVRGTEPHDRPSSLHIEEQDQPRPQQRAVVPESALQRFEAHASRLPHDSLITIQTESEVSIPSTLLSSATSSSTHRTAPSPSTPVSFIPPAASSFEDVREQKTYHALVGLQSETIQGHIAQANYWTGAASKSTRVTARRYGEELDENFISIRQAQALGLDIQGLDPEADGANKMVIVTTEGNNLVHKHAVGTVEVRWWTTHPPGFRVRMWVMEGGLPEGTEIALGKPFEKRRKHYQRQVSVTGSLSSV